MLFLFWDWITWFFSGDGKRRGGMLDPDPLPPPPDATKTPIGG